MNKKGQGLTLNTIIIAILVVLVLVVVAAFFLGGTKGLTDSIKRVFFQTTTGTDQTTAIEICKQRCDQIDTLVSVIPGNKGEAAYEAQYKQTVDGSAFCNKPFNIDKNNDDKVDADADGKLINYYCNTQQTTDRFENPAGSLGVQCKYVCGAAGSS